MAAPMDQAELLRRARLLLGQGGVIGPGGDLEAPGVAPPEAAARPPVLPKGMAPPDPVSLEGAPGLPAEDTNQAKIRAANDGLAQSNAARATAPITPTPEEQGGFLRRLTRPGEGLRDSPGGQLAKAMGIPGYGGTPPTLEEMGGAIAGAARSLPAAMGIPGSTPPEAVATSGAPPRPMGNAAGALASMTQGASAPTSVSPPSGRPAPSVRVGQTADVRVPNVAEARGLGAPSPGNEATAAAAGPPTAPPPPTPVQMARQLLTAQAPPSDLDRALEASRNNRLVAGLTRAGGAAIGRGSGPGYDNLDEQADRPLAELGMRRQEDARLRAEGAAAEDADPGSPQSAMARRMMAQLLPGFDVGEMSAAQIKANFPAFKELIERETERQKIQLQNQGELDQIKAKRVPGGAAGGLGKAGDAQLKELGEEFTKGGMAGFFQQYQDAKRILDDPKYADDLPGYGRLAGRLPDELVSDDGVSLRQALGSMLAEYRKGITGAGMSDSERAEYGQITGLLQSGSDASVRQGVERLARGMQARVRGLGSGMRSDVQSEYGRRVPEFSRAMRGEFGSTTAPAAKGAGPSADDLERLWSGG